MDPIVPTERVRPVQVAEDTWLIRQFIHGVLPVSAFINSLVIKGREPVIVDTGSRPNRTAWMEDVFGLVEPEDVRWVFLSHDDHDHTGNLREVLEMCPNATLVTNWLAVERLAIDIALPLDRVRWVNDGESFDAGDRTLVAVRPPLFDSPTTRGLFDARTRNYWAADCFATPVLEATENVADLDPGFWREGISSFNRMNSPWHQWLDHRKFGRHVDHVQSLGASAIASAHGPALHGEMIDEGFRLIREVPHLEAPPLPGQVDLDAMVASLAPPKELLVSA